MFKKILILLPLLLLLPTFVVFYFDLNRNNDKSIEIINNSTLTEETVSDIKNAIEEVIKMSIMNKIDTNKEFNKPNLLILDYTSNIEILNIIKQADELLVEVEEIRTYFYNEEGPETISKNIHIFRLLQSDGQWTADYMKDGSVIDRDYE